MNERHETANRAELLKMVTDALDDRAAFESWVESDTVYEFADTLAGNVVSVYLAHQALPDEAIAYLDPSDPTRVEIEVHVTPQESGSVQALTVPVPSWLQSVYRQLHEGLQKVGSTDYVTDDVTWCLSDVHV